MFYQSTSAFFSGLSSALFYPKFSLSISSNLAYRIASLYFQLLHLYPYTNYSLNPASPGLPAAAQHIQISYYAPQRVYLLHPTIPTSVSLCRCLCLSLSLSLFLSLCLHLCLCLSLSLKHTHTSILLFSTHPLSSKILPVDVRVMNCRAALNLWELHGSSSLSLAHIWMRSVFSIFTVSTSLWSHAEVHSLLKWLQGSIKLKATLTNPSPGHTRHRLPNHRGTDCRDRRLIQSYSLHQHIPMCYYGSVIVQTNH